MSADFIVKSLCLLFLLCKICKCYIKGHHLYKPCTMVDYVLYPTAKVIMKARPWFKVSFKRREKPGLNLRPLFYKVSGLIITPCSLLCPQCNVLQCNTFQVNRLLILKVGQPLNQCRLCKSMSLEYMYMYLP